MLTRIDTDLIRHDHPIGDVVTSYGIALRPVGRALVGRCPFHVDAGRPNLHVYPDNGSWYCYRCAVGGDVIGFVMRLEQLDFRAAVARLEGAANRTSIARATPIRRPKPRSPHCRPWGPDERACLAAAAELYHNRLLDEPAVLAYIDGRGIEPVTAERCLLGYANGDELAHYLRWRRLPPQAAIRVGLLGRDGRELLAGRVVVPEVRAGQPLWLIGRVLEDEGARSKYLSLPGPKPLLGWETAASSATAVLVEGVFDWLALVQWGFPALALVGTHVRPAVIRTLGARFSWIYLALDADDAGQQTAAVIAEALGPRAVRVSLPAGVKDVAELASKPIGRAMFANALRQAQAAPASVIRAA